MTYTPVTPWSLGHFETLTADNITSESNAINALIVSKILDDFLGAEDTIETFNGRTGSGSFDFQVNQRKFPAARLAVNGAQIEIDGGFENSDSITILEAKNVRHSDFHVRQLYYPYRRYADIAKKPVRLVFSQYTNLTYYLFEYEFENPLDYSSIALVRKAAYTFGSDSISKKELIQVCRSTRITTDDNYSRADIPFIQADRFDRVISIAEKLKSEYEFTNESLAEFLGTVQRQAGYYKNAGKYIGILQSIKPNSITLSEEGRRILNLPYKERQLELASKLFQHEIFNFFYREYLAKDKFPDKQIVVAKMQELHVCKSDFVDATYLRRASSAISWLKWLDAVPFAR